MANILTINYNHDVLEQMRCSVCKGYLSCSPIRILPNGTCICGACTLANINIQAYRNLPLEIFLHQLSFPCRFKKRGCTEIVFFDQGTDHESTCAYRSFSCPSLKACNSQGFSTLDVKEHFNKQHPELVKENAEFKFKMNEDAENVFIIQKDNVLFVVKYFYRVYENCLKYDVRYFRNGKKKEGSYRVQLLNNQDSNCNFSLKIKKCFVFDNSFYTARNVQILKLNKDLDILDNPTTVKVIIALNVLEACGTFTPPEEVSLIDYEFLETVRCNKCNNYLIPPLFDVGFGNICCICAESYSNPPLSTDEDLIKRLSQLNYPCQWRDCNFIGNCDNIQKHNFFCQFRLYRCKGLNCNSFISLATAVEHLRFHEDCQYLPVGIYKFVLPNKSKTTFIWTIKNGVLIVIEHSYVNNYYNEQTLKLFLDLCKCTVTVRFEHQHCNVKSKPYVLVSNSPQCIRFDEFPSCFDVIDELTLQIGECII